MRRNIDGEKIGKSSLFEAARKRARQFADNPGRLHGLLDTALRQAQTRKHQLQGVWESLLTSFRLLRAYASGSYREIPTASLVSIIAAIIYLVMPADLIPDILFSFGLLDDAALIGWILSSVRGDVDAFLEWERLQPRAEAGTAAGDPPAQLE